MCKTTSSKKFALIGAAGYIAPRHMKAIKDTGHELVAAVDPNDSVGIIDSYFPGARFFTEIERFDRHLEKLRRDGNGVDYVSICSPNYLHDSHVRLALRVNADAICEKPLVVNPWNLDALQELENENGSVVHTIFQLRLLPAIKKLKSAIDRDGLDEKADVVLTYVTRRGAWSGVSWKGSQNKSGGVAMNIGIHFFDMVQWLFGRVQESQVHLNQPEKMAGCLELEKARVRWFLSVDGDDLPDTAKAAGKYAHRSLTMNGEEIEFSSGFTELHTEMYKEILNGRGFGIDDARPSVQTVYDIRQAEVITPAEQYAHPMLSPIVA